MALRSDDYNEDTLYDDDTLSPCSDLGAQQVPSNCANAAGIGTGKGDVPAGFVAVLVPAALGKGGFVAGTAGAGKGGPMPMPEGLVAGTAVPAPAPAKGGYPAKGGKDKADLDDREPKIRRLRHREPEVRRLRHLESH